VICDLIWDFVVDGECYNSPTLRVQDLKEGLNPPVALICDISWNSVVRGDCCKSPRLCLKVKNCSRQSARHDDDGIWDFVVSGDCCDSRTLVPKSRVWD
jgi:hypothetical protein